MNLSQEQQIIIDSLFEGLIVSCQVKNTDPHYLPDIVTKLAMAAIWGGAVGIRANSPEDIKSIRAITDIPIIGLWKQFSKSSPVFITPTMNAVDEVINAGAEIVAVDATQRKISEGVFACDIIPKIREKYPNVLIFADIRDDQEAYHAAILGAHIVGPTLYRFGESPKFTDAPDFEMLSKIVQRCNNIAYVFMEGKITTPDEAIQSLYLGAHAVVVGNAITRPHITTLKFTSKMNRYQTRIPLLY